MKMNLRSFCAIVLALFIPYLSSCVTGGNSPVTATGLLYILDNVNNAVYVLDNISTLDGANDAVRTISGDNTLIQNPTAIADDSRRDILYVADSTAKEILAWVPASQTNGDIAPLRTYPGISGVVAMFSDISNDKLYAADALASTIFAWDRISTLPSGTAPTRSIPLDYVPSSLVVDTQRNLLYVGEPLTGIVNVYPNASSLGVAPPPGNMISDGTMSFVKIKSLTLNTPNNTLYVSESTNPSVEIFDDASTLNGTVIPPRELEGSSTAMTIHMGQILFLENVLYVNLSDISNSIGVWEDANQVTGDVAPTRTIQVTPSAEITGFAVDLAH